MIENSLDHHKFLTEKNEWIKAFMPKFAQKEYIDHFTEVHRNFTSQHTHAGMIYYLHYCWAKELNAVIRPDMVWNAILSMNAILAKEDPKIFQNLFSDDADQKKSLCVDVADDGINLDLQQLMTKMRSEIVSTEFFDLINSTRFESEVSHAHDAAIITFAQMATPYFGYCRNCCGIPSVEILGDRSEWVFLKEQVTKLKKFVPESFGRNDPMGYGRRVYHNYLDTAIAQIQEIITKNFDHEKDAEWLSNIFHYGKNSECGSGHDAMIVHGWILKFYWNYGESDLFRYPVHVNYVPFNDPKTGQKFVQMIGLSYSEIHDNTASPHYGMITYCVDDERIFNEIAINNE